MKIGRKAVSLRLDENKDKRTFSAERRLIAPDGLSCAPTVGFFLTFGCKDKNICAYMRLFVSIIILF